MPRAKRAHKTFHINVPEEDWEIMEWLSKQYNQSASVRELIRAAARQGGMVDLFIGQAASRTPGVRGRAKQPEQGESIAEIAARRAQIQNDGNAGSSESQRDDARQGEQKQVVCREKGKARSPSPKKSSGIKMDLSVLGDRAQAKETDDKHVDIDETQVENDDSKTKDTLKELMDLIDS